jgi:hypothetical protein
MSLCPLSKYNSRCCISRQRNHWAFLYFCTTSSLLSVESPEDTLCRRLVRVSIANGSVVPVLNKWVGEGRQVDHDDIRKIIKQFRHSNRFAHALQVLYLVLSFSMCIFSEEKDIFLVIFELVSPSFRNVTFNPG